MPEGIDIYSKYQTVTDWNAVRRADITWCYQKVSDGNTLRVPQSVGLARSAGVAQGGYHFSQVGSPVEQADILLNQCTKYGLLDLNPCLDMEDNPANSGRANIPPAQKADFVIAFGRRILARGHGFTLYANNSDWGFFGPKVMTALPQTFRWVARYGANPTVIWDAHQYTSSGSCPGIISNGLDRNRGKIPLNRKNVDMPLSGDDFKYLLYDNPIQDYGNLSQLLAEIKDRSRAAAALGVSIQKLTDLVVADSTNDLTREQFEGMLEGFFTTKVGPIIREVIREIDLEVTVNKEEIAEEVLNRMYGRLQQ